MARIYKRAKAQLRTKIEEVEKALAPVLVGFHASTQPTIYRSINFVQLPQ